jgi:hypothetical protein
MAIPTLNNSLLRLTDCIYFGDPISASVGSGFITQARTISTTAPLTGGGDMSADRTLAITPFAGSTPGSVPTSLGGTVNFLRADGSWNPPAVFTDVANGYAPASGGGVVNYLRADGTWAIPAGTGITGLTAGQIPVAQNATTIIDSRIAQGAADFAFRTSDAGGGGAYKGLILSEDALDRAILTGTKYTGAALAAAGVRIAATDGAGGGFASAIDIYGDTVRIDGILTLNWRSATAVNGVNNLLNVSGFDYPDKGSAFRVTGPTAAFSVGGAIPSPAGSSLSDANVCIIYNATAQPMTLINENAGTTAAYRFATGTGADVTLPGGYRSVATFLYDFNIARWVLASTSANGSYTGAAGYVPYASAAGVISASTLFHDSANNRYGFATATPAATVDVNGTLAVRYSSRVLAVGLNSDIPASTTSSVAYSAAGDFSVGGIVPHGGGSRLLIYNTSAVRMTIVHEDGSSAATNQIRCPGGANLALATGRGCVELAYNSTFLGGKWVVVSYSDMVASGAANELQMNNNGSALGRLTNAAGLTWDTSALALNMYSTGTGAVLCSEVGARALQLGAPTATPAAYTLRGNRSRGGTDDNVRGGKLSVGGGAGTGTAGGGDTALTTAYPLTNGNTQNPHVDRLVYAAKPTAMTNSAATTVATLKVRSESYAGGTLWVSVCATDGTDMQVRRMRVEWGAVNKASTITVVLGAPEEVDCTPVGTLTATITALDNADDTFSFQVTPISSLTTTVFEAWTSIQHDGRDTVEMA